MTPRRFKLMDKVGITGSAWLGPFWIRHWDAGIDGHLYDLYPVKDEAKPIWGISETALYRWPDAGGRPSWDKEVL